ncbi:unnamed protein product [Lymnaea stagnalis]|uniref:Macro domain-containing protein n=1 Tax=Lymnaea stagnalis TaxID=6523 RepID=A0AAV2HW80_LYMST
MSEPAKYNINLCHNQDITTVKADVLVSSIHRSKNLQRGTLATYIHKNAGPEVQSSLYMQEHSELVFGQIVTTPPGRLSRNFKCLLFVCLYEWRDGNEEMLQASVFSCLDIASNNKHKSIAFPALGMGGLKYPPVKSTLAILKAINLYFRDCEQTSLENVYICLQDKNSSSVKTFMDVTTGYLESLHVNLGSKSGGPELNIKGHQQFANTLSGDISRQSKTTIHNTSPASGAGSIQAASMFPSLIQKCKSGKDVAALFTIQGNKNSVIYWNIGPTFNPTQNTVGVKAEVSLHIPKMFTAFFGRR